MERKDSQFDDAALRKAVKRLWSTEVAPPALRHRVTNALAAERRSENYRRLFTLRGPIYGVAAAAVLLIAFGLSYSAFFGSDERSLPTSFVTALITVHDEGLSGQDQQMVMREGSNDYRRLQAIMRQQLGHSVIAEQVSGGWEFKGASICTLSNVPASHLIFSREGETLSLFSVAAAALHGVAVEGTRFAPEVEKDHAMTGFVAGHAAHLIVVSADQQDFNLGELAAMRNVLQATRPLTVPEDVGAANHD